MNREELEREYIELGKAYKQDLSRRKIDTFYPEEGPLSRDKYKPHMAFFRAGGEGAFIRAILAANRVGKSEGIGAYEVALHLTGIYPDWWEGKRFRDGPSYVWVAGTTNAKTAKVNQVKLLGPINDLGTGMIPGDLLDLKSKRMKPGVVDAIEKINVKHTSGRWIELNHKSYAEGRESFESEEPDIIWLDEETTLPIFGECVTRVTPTEPGREPGQILCTFTPLKGMSEVVKSFMPDGKIPNKKGVFSESGGKFIINATWDDAPHLTKEAKERLWAEIPPYQREARTKGIPQLGSGAIFQISEENVMVDDFEIPMWYSRVFGLDVGWNWTAAVWLAIDPDTDIAYVYSTYKRSKDEPAIHAAAIKARGDWIPGVIDPAAAGSSQKDGKKLINEYRNLLYNDLYPADNAVEAGLMSMWKRLSNGTLKVFKSCGGWFDEFRMYRRDETGRIVKDDDHLMDSTRYACLSGINKARSMPDEEYDDERGYLQAVGVGRNAITGY